MDKRTARNILDKALNDRAKAYEVVALISYLLDSQLKSPRHLFGKIEEVEIFEDDGLYDRDGEEEILSHIEYEEEGVVSHRPFCASVDDVPEFGFRCVEPVDGATYYQVERLKEVLQSAIAMLDSVTVDPNSHFPSPMNDMGEIKFDEETPF